MHLDTPNNQLNNHQQQQTQHNLGQSNMVQVQVQDNMVSVIDDNKEHKELATHLAQAQLHIQGENNQLPPQAMSVQHLQQLQVQQVLDNVVRMETAEQNANSAGGDEQMHDIKDEKTLQSATKFLSAQFGLQDIKPNLMDVRTADGSIVKISTGLPDQDLAKTIGVEMVQNMFKVNVDDFNQLLAYHEVFGKIQTEPTAGTLVQTGQNQQGVNLQGGVVNNIASVPKVLENEQEASTSGINAENSPTIIAGMK